MQCCQALAEAVSGNAESNGNIIERILYLDGYIFQRSRWKWPSGEKMNVLGCLMLQIIFKYPKVQCAQLSIILCSHFFFSFLSSLVVFGSGDIR